MQGHFPDPNALHKGSLTISLTKWFNLCRKCAVVGDDAASVLIYNCNMHHTVVFACADYTFADIDFAALERHSIPIFNRALHTQAAAVGIEFP